MNTGNVIKIYDVGGGLKVMWAVPEKHIINFFWPYWHKQKEVKSNLILIER